jgi:plastocyanin
MKTIITILVIILLVALGMWIYDSSVQVSPDSTNQTSSATTNTNTNQTPRTTTTVTTTTTTTATPATSTATQTLPASPAPASTTVAIRGFEFTPKTINIKKGTTVVWTNYDSVAHTVTSDDSKFLNSQLLSAQQSYSQTFTEPGIYLYHCKPHPSMTGTVIVTN